MFAWINFEYFENELMDEILTTALEWGDYELAIEILESTSRCTVPKERTTQAVFTKFHMLAIIYERQGLLTLAEKIYNRGLSCLLEEESIDSVEVKLFLKNYSSCLRKMNMSDLANGLETIAETFQYTCFSSLRMMADATKGNPYPLAVANVA